MCVSGGFTDTASTALVRYTANPCPIMKIGFPCALILTGKKTAFNTGYHVLITGISLLAPYFTMYGLQCSIVKNHEKSFFSIPNLPFFNPFKKPALC